MSSISNRSAIRQIIPKHISPILQEAGLSSKDKVITKELFGEGSAFVLKIQQKNLTYVLKVFPGSTSSRSMRAEKTFYTLAQQHKIPVPKVIYASDVSQALPVAWLLIEWIEGTLLSQIESKSERYESAKSVGNLLRLIHQIPTDGFGWLDTKGKWIGKDASWPCDFFTDRIQRLITKEDNALPFQELQKIYKATTQSKELLQFKQPRLLHGDITGGNVIVLKQNITLIDPGEVISGDPMSDLGYSQTTRLRPEFSKGVWDGYTSKHSLTKKEHDRFLRWRLLRQCVVTCNAIKNKSPRKPLFISDMQKYLNI